MGRARGKLVLKPITNEKSRKVTFQKRSEGLVKKASELSTLCGVDVCMVCYGSDGELKTWPKDRSQVFSVIERYNSVSKDERNRRKQDITPFIEADKIEQTRIGNSEFMYPTWNARLDERNEESLKALECVLDDKLEKVRAKVEFLKVNNKAPKNPRGKYVMVDDFIKRNRILHDRKAKIEASKYYGDVDMNTSYGGGQYHYHWRVHGYGMMDLMVNGDEMRDCSYNVPHYNPSIFHHQPPALRTMFPTMTMPMPMPMPMQMPMPMHQPPPLPQQQPIHPPPPPRQQPSMPMEPPMPLSGFQHHQPHH